MAATEPADKIALDEWYSGTAEVREVSERDLGKFFMLAAKFHAVPALEKQKYAQMLIADG